MCGCCSLGSSILYLKALKYSIFSFWWYLAEGDDKNYSVSRIQTRSSRRHRIITCVYSRSKVALYVRFNKCAIPRGKIVDYYYFVSAANLRGSGTRVSATVVRRMTARNASFFSLSARLFVARIVYSTSACTIMNETRDQSGLQHVLAFNWLTITIVARSIRTWRGSAPKCKCVRTYARPKLHEIQRDEREHKEMKEKEKESMSMFNHSLIYLDWAAASVFLSLIHI